MVLPGQGAAYEVSQVRVLDHLEAHTEPDTICCRPVDLTQVRNTSLSPIFENVGTVSPHYAFWQDPPETSPGLVCNPLRLLGAMERTALMRTVIMRWMAGLGAET
jgi:hypothetical protein